MEKTTKKKKKTKGMKKRIGIIAVGGLSLVLTICLSVGATLAWFAGSTWSSNQMYLGGPVYVEMAGLGKAGSTGGTGSDEAKWQGGAGNLTVQAATQRTTGTHVDSGNIPNNILLPGQKFEIYSQARVFSTATTTSIGTNESFSQSSGANVTNTSKSATKHVTDKGRITSTTSSVIRARFSVSVEFDPTVGFNNFTDKEKYADNYPVQSGAYNGEYSVDNTDTTTPTDDTKVVYDGALNWFDALGKPAFKNSNNTTAGLKANPATYPLNSRRDAVPTGTWTTTIAANSQDLKDVRSGAKKSVYAWKFVSYDVYHDANITAEVPTDASAPIDAKYSFAKMPAPFNGDDKSYGQNGYYGVWILTTDTVSVTTDPDGDGPEAATTTTGKVLSESDAFYKARCNSYIDSYVEEYVTEYGEIKTRTIGDSLASLENSLNQSFVNLVNDSSDAIIAGKVFGMTKDAANGKMTYAADPYASETETIDPDGEGPNEPVANPNYAKKYKSGSTNASWLYIDPKIGNDTNTNELSTSTGGWWYLVECDNGGVKANSNKVAITKDSATYTDVPDATPDDGKDDSYRTYAAEVNTPTGATPNYSGVAGTDYFVRGQQVVDLGKDGVAGGEGENADTVVNTYAADDSGRLYAKLFEINPLVNLADNGEAILGTNGTDNITKVVSYSFPFVNGTSALPGDALTNVFANAKITIQISFQALQAFFPYSTVIDRMDYTNPLLGTAKALNISNAIPIFNEAFDYQENLASSGSISGL